MKIRKLAQIALLSSAASMAIATPSYAGFSSAAVVAAVNKVRDMLKVGDERIQETLQMGFGQNTANSQSQIAADSKMKDLEANIDRLRKVEDQKIAAIQRSANTHMECVIRTRTKLMNPMVESDRILSRATLDGLAEMAAWKVGHSVGESGEPVQTVSVEEKSTKLLQQISTQSHPTLRGAPHTAALSISSGDLGKDEDPALLEARISSCEAFASVVDGHTRNNTSDFAPNKSADSSSLQVAAYADTARGSLAQAYLYKICEQANPNSGPPADLAGHLTDSAQKSPALLSLTENGISWKDAREIMAKEWYLNKDLEKEMVGGTTQGLTIIARQMATLTYQMNDLYNLIEENGKLGAGQLAAVNELAALQMEANRLLENQSN